MTLGPCFQLLNSGFFDNLRLRISNCGDAALLQEIVNEAFAELSTLQAVIEGEIAHLLPMQALLEIPTTPTAVVTWAGNFITSVLTPMLKPYITLAAQVAQIASEVSALESAISEAADKFPGVTINVPGISITCTV